MGIFGGYLAGARAAREDKLRERQQDEAERRARADEALRQREADRAQANADRQFEQSVTQADRDYALRSRAAEQDAALKTQDMELRRMLGELEYAMKGDEMQGRREDRSLTREIKQQDAQMAREEMGFKREKMASDREMQKEQLAGANEDRLLRREESQARRAGDEADRALRKQALDQGAYQFERTQANADQRLGLELDKGRIETQVLGTQLATTKQRWEDEQKERGLREQNNKLGVGYMMSMAMMKPSHQLDANDIAEITQQYPEFAKLGLQGFTMKYNPDTGNMDGLMIVGDGKDQNSVKVFDQAQMANALRGAGYTDESIKRTFEYMRPDIGITKLKAATQEKENLERIHAGYRMQVLGVQNDGQMDRERFKARADRAKAEVKVIEDRIKFLKSNLQVRSKTEKQKAEYQREIDALEERKLKAYDDVFAIPSATPTETPAPAADPLVTKYSKYLAK